MSARPLKRTVEQMAGLSVLYQAESPINAIEFSERLWNKRNRFAAAFLRRLIARGWVSESRTVMGSGYVSDELYSLTPEGLALFAAPSQETGK